MRGAVVDELRSADWASRGTRRAERALAGAEERLTQQLGRHPSPAEVAAEVGSDGAEMLRTRERVQRAAVLSLNADRRRQRRRPGHGPGLAPRSATRSGSSPRSGPSTLHAAVEALPERLRIVVQGYFLGRAADGRDRRELGVSESRISQMRAQALELLREGMTRALDDHDPAIPTRRRCSCPHPDATQLAAAGVAARRREEYYARVAALAGTTGPPRRRPRAAPQPTVPADAGRPRPARRRTSSALA